MLGDGFGGWGGGSITGSLVGDGIGAGLLGVLVIVFPPSSFFGVSTSGVTPKQVLCLLSGIAIFCTNSLVLSGELVCCPTAW